MKRKFILPLLVACLTFGGILISCDNGNNNQNISEAPIHYDGQGVPSNEIGKNGDTYTDLLSGATYTKIDGAWVKDQVSNSFSGVGEPDDRIGVDGDTYTDTETGDVYTKQNGFWVKTSTGTLGERYLVTFDLNGGTMPDGSIYIEPQEVAEGRWVKEPPYAPIKQNSTFLGWYVGNSDTKWVFTQGVYGDLVLKAKYSVNEDERMYITIDPNNGEPTYQVETFVGDYLRLTSPQKEGHNFIGWFINGGSEKFSGYVDGSLQGASLVAKYEKSKFNLYFRVENDNSITITGIKDINAVSLTIPATIDGKTVKAISSKAFNNRIYLNNVTLPNTLQTVEPGAFNGARALQEINVDDTNPYLTDVNGVLFTKDMRTLLLCPPKNCTTYKVPSTVKKIGEYAFYYHRESGVSNITFNEGLEEIGDYAFYCNLSFTTLKFPSTLKRVGVGAFNCVSAQGTIQKVDFNEGLEIIDDSAFVGAYFKEILSLPSTIKKIGSYAFANCTAITKFVFPKSLEELGDNAFAGATGILNIDIQTGNTNFKVQENVLYNYEMTKAVMCPSGKTDLTIIPEGVEEIGDYAFYMVDQCQDYQFPTTLKRIGKQAFAHCYGLRSFVIPDSVEEIGENCFDLCEKLSSITIGSGLKHITSEAFIECRSLKTIEIPSTVKSIGKSAIAGSGLTSITFNEGLEKIEEFAFYSFDGSDDYSTTPASSLTTLVLPNSLTTIESSAFSGHSSLYSVTFGSGLTSLAPSVFEGANITEMKVASGSKTLVVDNLVLYDVNKTRAIFGSTKINDELQLPSTLTKIEPFAFYNCKDITKVTFPNSLQEIGEGAFYNLFYNSKSGSLHFGSSLRIIGPGAFHNSYATSITFDEGVEEIGEGAFTYALEPTLKLPNSLKVIGVQAFSLNSKLTSVTFGNGLTTIGDEAFYQCLKLNTAVNLGASVSSIGNGPFLNCTSLPGIIVDQNNPYYVSEKGLLMNKDKTEVIAYANGYQIGTVIQSSLNIPSSVTSINKYGLAGAVNLTSVTLPDGLTTIGEEAFSNSSNIASLAIPSSVTFIGEKAFNRFKTTQTISFTCSEEEAFKKYNEGFLNGCSANIVYQG